LIDQALRNFVRDRAGSRCEYCGIHCEQEPYFTFHVEHITARQHGGGDEPENLGWACHHCNLHKGTNLSGIDPDSRQVVILYHPRRDQWDDHFERRGPLIVGRTSCGRATVQLLKYNAPSRIELRSAL